LRFTLYTDKTVAQCLSAVNQRVRGGTRAGLEGWTEKSGAFSLAVSTRVARRFARKTRLQATLEREGGVTIIRGFVPDGVGRQGQIVIFGALLVVWFLLLAGGNALLAIIAVISGAWLFIPLTGDHHNSTVLMRELRSLLKAKDTPPSKKPTQPKSAAARTPTPASRPTAFPSTRRPTSSQRSAKPPPR